MSFQFIACISKLRVGVLITVPTVVYARLSLLYSFLVLISRHSLVLLGFVQEKAPNADNPASVAENIEKAKSITQSRILTNEDFNKIKLRQVVKEVDGKGSKKRTFTQANEEGGGPL